MSGWLEKKSRYLRSWRKRWMVLGDGMFRSYKTEDKKTETECIDLKLYTNVCNSGTLTFDIFKQTKIAFSFRAASNDESKAWIDTIAAEIIHVKRNQRKSRISEDEVFRAKHYFLDHYTPSPSTTIVKLHTTVPFDLPSPFAHKATETNDLILIHTHLKLNKNQLLRARFARKLEENHPELLMYGTRPQYDNDQVIRIDLICINEDETPQNKVRLQCKAWGELKNKDCNQVEYPIIKSLQDIASWCMKYQEQNTGYSYKYNNCRKFMIELCHFLQIKFPDAYLFEEMWYATRNKCKIGQSVPVYNNNNNTNPKMIRMHDEKQQFINIKRIMSNARNGHSKFPFQLTQNANQNVSMQRQTHNINTQNENINNMQQHSLELSVQEEEKFEELKVNDMFYVLRDEGIIDQCQMDNVRRQKYKPLRKYTYCFIVKMEDKNNKYKKIENNKYKMMMLLNVLLVKKGDKNRAHTSQDKYYYYEFEISYEQLNCIDSTIKNMCGVSDYDDEYRTVDGCNMERIKALYWIKKKKKPPLRHPDTCHDACYYYAKYLQVLLCCNFIGLDIIYNVLKLPPNLVILLQKLNEHFKEKHTPKEKDETNAK